LSVIASELQRWHAKHVRGRKTKDGKPDKRAIAVVDYAQLVKATRQKGGNREQEVAEISGTLKRLAMDLDLTMFMLAQLSRACEQQNRPPQLSDLRESGAIEQDADIVLFPYQDGDKRQIIVGKHRDGKVGYADVRFVEEIMTFYALTNQEPPKSWQYCDQ
jgi:replicative DNA helicase